MLFGEGHKLLGKWTCFIRTFRFFVCRVVWFGAYYFKYPKYEGNNFSVLTSIANLPPQVSGNPMGMHSPSNGKDHHDYDRDGKGDQGRFVAEGNPKESIYPEDWNKQDDAEY